MRKSICFICAFLVFCMMAFCSCDSDNIPNPSNTSANLDEYPSVKTNYTLDDFPKDSFKCSVSFSNDKFNNETVIDSELAIGVYNAMNMGKWIANEKDSYESSNEIILLTFYINNQYKLSNSYGSVYISSTDLVSYTKGTMDTEFKVYKAPKGTYNKIVDKIYKK